MRLPLSSDRIVSVTQLYQRDAHLGVLCGGSLDLLKRKAIERLLEEADGYTAKGAKPLFIEPDASPSLPAVACIAVFESGALMHDESEPYSSVTIAWFQEEFGAISSEILKRIRVIDWERCATSWCW